MPHSDKYLYPRVKIPRPDEAEATGGEAWKTLQREAADYGVTEGELISLLAIAWTKLRKGELTLFWPVGGAASTNGTSEQPPEKSQAEDEQEQRERKEARLAAARAALLE
jgi:hypothetical protein